MYINSIPLHLNLDKMITKDNFYSSYSPDSKVNSLKQGYFLNRGMNLRLVEDTCIYYFIKNNIHVTFNSKFNKLKVILGEDTIFNGTVLTENDFEKLEKQLNINV